MRLSVLNAMVWRLIAEVLRRHSPQHQFSIFESHPGISARGRLHLVLRLDNRSFERCSQVIFNLGGPSGTMDFVNGSGSPRCDMPFAVWLLDRDPIEVVDTITRGLGLKVPESIGASSPPTIAARVLADSLARESLARGALRVTSGWVDTSYGSCQPGWVSFMPVASRALDTTQLGSRVVALHDATSDEAPLMDIDAAPLAIIDLDDGKVLLVSGQSTIAHINLPTEYASNGRRVGPLSDRLLAHLNR